MKGGGGGGGDKPAGGGVASLLRLESQGSLRRLSVAAGFCCFFFLLLVFLLSSGHDAIGLDVLGARASLRLRAAPPQGQGASESHGDLLQQRSNAAAADDEAAKERVHVANVANQTAVAGARTTSDVERESEMVPAANSDGDGQAAAPGDNTTRSDRLDQPRPPLCDFSDHRSDVCELSGDIRMDANASSFFLVVDPASAGAGGATYKVRPYARKGDATSMGRVTEVTVRTTTTAAPRCTRTHASPAVVFSIGGYTGNLFHDFTDVIVPLYNTARRYRGDVQLVVTDAARWWLAKYGAVLRGLSRHPPLDLAAARAAGEVHCFSHAVVGLRAHGGELTIDRERSPDGLGMPGFTRFLRRALSLPRDAPTRPGGGGAPRPRLLVISRRGTRLLLNTDAVVRAAEEVGFEAVVSGELYATTAADVADTGRRVNSFDAVVGVHGAGLTNMAFLPPGAAVVQIVPWGGLRWVAQLDFGAPAVAMGLRYIQYEVAVDESTLKDRYPRDHEVFTNPTALHKRGFAFVRQTFLKHQDVAVDIRRFKPVLLQALHSLAAL
ncbi:alpha-1,3-arabinosyltransferase XAT2-like isoform X1 [Oryza brachyantha]|uniref:alpha-1,3-arabinosyltransferase XAT2-like isoform X1 n=1 Tax=Oryza brachyantha TaxID=4533 RepID=UPI001ADB86AA|nr:alpha-1,3-arabinosyltransferase XAT2-like isoform X1 [Oryza brachyantha]